MYHKYKQNKKLQTKWDDYQFVENEPKHKKQYYISPELEDELLDRSYFLKARVRRNMRRIRSEYSEEPEHLGSHGHGWHIYKHA